MVSNFQDVYFEQADSRNYLFKDPKRISNITMN